MFHVRSVTRGVSAAVLLVAVLSGRAAAQRGALPASMTGHRSSPRSDTLSLRIAVQMTPGWHIGAAQPGKFGVPTELKWRLPAGWRVLASRWPRPTSAVVGRDTVFQYDGPFTIETTLVTHGPRHAGPVQAHLSYGICRDVCIPGRLTLTYEAR